MYFTIKYSLCGRFILSERQPDLNTLKIPDYGDLNHNKTKAARKNWWVIEAGFSGGYGCENFL